MVRSAAKPCVSNHVGPCAALHPGYETIQQKSGPTGPPFRVTSMKSSAAVAADHGAHGVVGTEILGAVDIEQG
jgi:hypothetical protein